MNDPEYDYWLAALAGMFFGLGFGIVVGVFVAVAFGVTL